MLLSIVLAALVCLAIDCFLVLLKPNNVLIRCEIIHKLESKFIFNAFHSLLPILTVYKA